MTGFARQKTEDRRQINLIIFRLMPHPPAINLDSVQFTTLGLRSEACILPSVCKSKSPVERKLNGAFVIRIGGDLLSHIVSHAVPSALKSLTSVFGMGTGGSSSL